MPRTTVDPIELSRMVRNDKKNQSTNLVGRMVAVMPNNLDYTETGVPYSTVLIPANTVVGDVYGVVKEAFDAGATFNVGTADNPTCFFTDITGSTVTPKTCGAVQKVALCKYFASATEVIVTPTYAGDNTKGEFIFVLELFELEASTGRHTR